jgi:hypothetical protein
MRWDTKLVRWALAGALSAAVLSVGLIGFAHTSAGRPLLRLLPGANACPVGLDVKLSPAEREARRQAALQPFRGMERAAARPALGFMLGRTTRADVLAWSDRFHVECAPTKDATAIACPSVPSAALGDASFGSDVEDMMFAFDPRGELIGVNAAHRKLDPEQAARFVARRTAELSEQAGPPARTTGEPTAGYLVPGSVAQAGVEFRFRDYLAEVTATQLGALGLLVREQYQSISD